MNGSNLPSFFTSIRQPSQQNWLYSQNKNWLLRKSQFLASLSEESKLEMLIRMALPEDASAIASVLSESFAEYKSFYTPQGFTATTPASEEVLSRINEGPVWIALHDQLIVGTVAAVPLDETLYIRGMAIIPAARGRAIGEMLLRQVESFASAHGYKRLLLSTTPFLTRAIRLYEHFGFQRSSDGPHDLFGTPLFTMVKSLHDAARKVTKLDVVFERDTG